MSAEKIEIWSGGELVSSASSMSKKKIYAGYTMIAGSGGTATSTSVSSGGCMVVDGGAVSKTNIYNGGTMYVHSGTFIGAKTYVWDGGRVEILGSGSNFFLYGGSLCVSDGGVASCVNPYRNTCSVTVFSGGKIVSTHVNQGAQLMISSGGTASKTVLSSGTMTVAEDAVADDVFQYQSGTLLYVLSGGKVYNLRNDGADTYVSSGGVISNSIVWWYRQEASMGEPEKAYYASMTLMSGAIHQGTMDIESSTVMAEDGAVIDFTLTNIVPDDGKLPDDEKIILISGYDCIIGSPTYTLTVNSTQKKGSYYLADNVKSFNKTITVVTQDDELTDDRTLSVDETIACNNKFYTLSINSDSILNLSIAERFAVEENKTLTMKEGIVQSGRPEAYAGSGGAVEVQTGGLLNNSGVVVFAGCSATGDGGAVLNGGTVTLDEVTFSNCMAGKLGGAVYNKEGAILNIAGAVALETVSDTVVNNGTLNWDLTGASAENEKTDFSISNWSLVSGSGTYTATVDLIGKQYGGDYLLAKNVEQSFSVKLKCGDVELSTLSVGSAKTSVSYITENGGYYTLSLNPAKDVTLSARSLCFYNESSDPSEAWEEGEAVSCTFQGTEITGTVGDGTFFVNAAAAASTITAQNAYGVAVKRDYTKSTCGNGGNSLIAEGTYNKMYFGGCIIAESKADPEEVSYTTNILGGDFKNSIACGDAVNGDYDVTQLGNLNLCISGGTFAKRVAGGMYYTGSNATGSAVLEGDVNLTITGGTFNGRIYGGCNAKNAVYGTGTLINGNVNITVTTDNTHLVAINECLVAGSRGAGVITGSVTVTFTGTGGDCLKFGKDCIVYGGSNSDFAKVNSEGVKTISSSVGEDNGAEYRNLVFSDFSGEFDAEIKLFGTISFENNSLVTFTDEKLDLWSVEIWNFEFGSSASGVTANEFDGDVLKFDMTGYDGQDWNVLSGSTEAFTGFANEEENEVWFGSSQATYNKDLACWTDGTYKLALNDDKTGMIVSMAAQV